MRGIEKEIEEDKVRVRECLTNVAVCRRFFCGNSIRLTLRLKHVCLALISKIHLIDISGETKCASEETFNDF